MSYPYFKLGLSSEPSVPAEQIPTLARGGIEDPAGYIPSPELAHAVNVALILGMPLLLTGEPGAGKTQLAYALAKAIGSQVHKFETKSTSAARDLFYTFDALSAFRQREGGDTRRFVRYQALGRAILEAFEAGHPRVAALLPPTDGDFRHVGPRRAVVLIDEIDKAPRDFPNDLLNEIDRLYFRVPELQNISSPGADDPTEGVDNRYRPIIVLTSNSEKGLPDPFLRRCVYFHIPFPAPDRMIEIVSSRIGTSYAASPLLADAIDLFYKLRPGAASPVKLDKPPSTAEFLNWLQVLIQLGVAAGDSLRSRHRELLGQTISTLVKKEKDQARAIEYIQKSW